MVMHKTVPKWGEVRHSFDCTAQRVGVNILSLHDYNDVELGLVSVVDSYNYVVTLLSR